MNSSPAPTRPVSEGVRWTAVVTAWMFMMLAETVHAAVREFWLAPVVGDWRARQLGVFIGSVLVLLIAWACARWIRATTRAQQWLVGSLWVMLTLLFEFSLGRARHLSWSRLWSDYDPTRGGLMWLGLVVLLLAPAWVMRWPGARRPELP